MKIAGVILGAGLGSRMQPLTAHLPKPLLPLMDRSLLAHLADRLIAAGATTLYVNLYYRPAQMRAELTRLSLPVPVHTVIEPSLTGPAGALCAFHTDFAEFDLLLVSSADVVLGTDLRELVQAHRTADPPGRLTFAIVRRDHARNFGVLDIDVHHRLVGAREKPDVPDDEQHWISAGVYCVHPSLVAEIPRDQQYDYARDLAPAMLAAGDPVHTHHCIGYWGDIGTPQAFRTVTLDALAGLIPWLPAGTDTTTRGWTGRIRIGPDAVVADTAVLRGPVDIGAGSRIGANAWLERTVVLPGTSVPAGQVVLDGILANRADAPSGGN